MKSIYFLFPKIIGVFCFVGSKAAVAAFLPVSSSRASLPRVGSIGTDCFNSFGIIASSSPPSLPNNRLRFTTCTHSSSSTALSGVRSTMKRIFRRVRTLEREDTSLDDMEDEPKKMYRLVYHDDCDYDPTSVARVVAKAVPSLDRRAAYHLISFARESGRGVPLMVTDQKNAERYCAILRHYGLQSTVELHDYERA